MRRTLDGKCAASLLVVLSATKDLTPAAGRCPIVGEILHSTQDDQDGREGWSTRLVGSRRSLTNAYMRRFSAAPDVGHIEISTFGRIPRPRHEALRSAENDSRPTRKMPARFAAWILL